MAMSEAPEFKFRATRRHGAPMLTWVIYVQSYGGPEREFIQIRINESGIWQVWTTGIADEDLAFNWKDRFTKIEAHEELHVVLQQIRAWYQADWLRDHSEIEFERQSEMAWLNLAEYDPEAVAFEEWERSRGVIH